jgi:hypothetical protein
MWAPGMGFDGAINVVRGNAVKVSVTSYSQKRWAGKSREGSNHPYAELTAKGNG